jgi:hypothetical protein
LALRIADDAADASDDLTDANADASADAAGADGSTDASPDICLDGSHDAARDVSVDGTAPDATDDATGEPSPDVADEAGDDADDGTPPSIDASGPDAGGRADAARDIGTSDEPRIVQACYIKPAAGGVATECAPIGPGEPGSACNDSLECGALHACVEVDERAVCRPVYCPLPSVCLKGSYYQEAPLRVNGATRRDINVPVCLPVDNCTLLSQPSPCPGNKVCTVVGSERDTTCLEPGSAKVGESCDPTGRCAEGLLCSRFSNQCVKICHVDPNAKECPTGTCQGGNRSLPDGFGICVGQTDGG